MQYINDEDDQQRAQDQMKKTKEKLRNEKRSQQNVSTLRQQRERVYLNGNRNEPMQQQQQQFIDYMNYQQMQQQNPQFQFNQNNTMNWYQNDYMAGQYQYERQIYDFSNIPNQMNYKQDVESLDDLMLQYPALNSLYMQQKQEQQQQQYNQSQQYQQYQQQQNFFYNPSTEQISDSTQIKPFYHKQQHYSHTIHEDDQEEDTQDIYLNQKIRKNKQTQIINQNPRISDNYQGAQQYSNKLNMYQNEKKFDNIFSPIKNNNNYQNYFQEQQDNNPLKNAKIINDLSHIQLTPRNKYSNQYKNDHLELKKSQSANSKSRNYYPEETINFEIASKFRQNQQPQTNGFNFQTNFQKQLWQDNPINNNNNFNKINETQFQKYKTINQQKIIEQGKENTVLSSAKKNDLQNAALNFSKNQLITIKDFEFSLNKKIGEGSFSQVYLGNKKSNPKFEVAIKIIDLQKQGSKFRDEIQICMKVNGNQNILRIYDHHIDQKSNKCYLFLEYCKEGNLQQVTPKISRRQAIIYFRQILDGMKELLKLNIIHRDLKLENILLNDGQAKISDFGLSKQVLNSQLDVNSIKCGTPSTMAPEIFFSMTTHPSYNNKCDVWSLGIILHELFYKIHPYNMNKEMLRRFQRVTVDNKCDIVEDFLSKSLVKNQISRLNLDEIFNHDIYMADISKFQLLEQNNNNNSRDFNTFKQKQNQNNVKQITNQNEVEDTTKDTTEFQNKMQQYKKKSSQPDNKIQENQEVINSSQESFSMFKSIIQDILTGKNIGLSVIILIFIGLVLSIIFQQIFSSDPQKISYYK